jgi:DNA repair exonuclease SbcCD ATPase subunit
MILDFAKLVIVNFGSFLNEHELDLASFGPGLHFVKGQNKEEPRLGSNGAGKSSLWGGLCWCLYGKTPDGRRNPDIQPRFGDKATTVELSLLIDTKPRTVTRTTHPNSLLLDSKEVGQEQIDQLIGLTFDVFVNTILLGQGRPLFFDLAPKAKMDLFVSVLNLDRWDERAAYASEAVSSLQGRESMLVGELRGMDTQRTQLDALLTQATRRRTEWNQEQEQLLKTAQEQLKDLKSKRETVEKEKAGYDLAYDSASTELKAAQVTSRQLADEGEKLVADRSPWTTQVALHKEKARQLTDELQTLGEADECPTCGQSLKGTNLSKHKAELKKQLVEATKALRKAEGEVLTITSKILLAKPKLERSRLAEQRFQSKANTARNSLVGMAPVLADLNAQINQLEAGTKKVETNPYTEQVMDLKRKITKLGTDYDELDLRIKKLSAQIERTKFWVKGFKEVRLYVIEEVLQELELTTNAALEEVGLVDWQVQYSIEKELKSGNVQRGLNVMIQSPKDKSPVKFECWSGGEGQRLRLVGALALSEVLLARAGVEPKMEILDEPSRGLSDVGIIDLSEFLAERASMLRKTTFYVDHRVVESSRFASVLTVVKTKKGSELVV